MPSVATTSNSNADTNCNAGAIADRNLNTDINCNIQITSNVRARNFNTQERVESATSQLYDSTLF
jgi:flagellar basal body P-ring protein FlgI